MKFIWTGPSEAMEIKNDKGETLFEGWAVSGKTEIDLPEEFPMRANWESRGWITPVKEETRPARRSPRTDAPSGPEGV